MDGWQKVVWGLVAILFLLVLSVPLFGHRGDEPPGQVQSAAELLNTSGELSHQVGTQIGKIRSEVRDARSDCAEIRRLCGEIQRVAREGVESCGQN